VSSSSAGIYESRKSLPFEGKRNMITTLSLILGGCFAFLLMFALAGTASAATDDALVSTVSSQTDTTTTDQISADSPVGSVEATVGASGGQFSVESSTGSTEATVGGDGASVSADSPVASAQVTVGGDGASVSADSPVASAQVTVGGDGASVSADSPVASAQVTVGGDGSEVCAESLVASVQAAVGGDGAEVCADSPLAGVQVTVGGGSTDSPGLDVSIRPPTSSLDATAPESGAQTDAPQLPTDRDRSPAIAESDQPVARSSWFGQEISETFTREVGDVSRVHRDAGSPTVPEGPGGTLPAPSSYSEHGPAGMLSWLILIALFIPLWYLLTDRSRMPHGAGGVLALPG
jgi:hypothetical protein